MIKFVIYRDWQCCLLAKVLPFYSTDRIARRTLLDYASDPLTFKGKNLVHGYCGNKSACFNGETRGHARERDSCNKRNRDNVRTKRNGRLSVYSLDCNVNRGSFAIIVHCTRAFCPKNLLSIPNEGSTCINCPGVGRVNN